MPAIAISIYNDDIDDKALKPDNNPICKEPPKVDKLKPPDFDIVVTGGGFTFDNVVIGAIIL